MLHPLYICLQPKITANCRRYTIYYHHKHTHNTVLKLLNEFTAALVSVHNLANHLSLCEYNFSIIICMNKNH